MFLLITFLLIATVVASICFFKLENFRLRKLLSKLPAPKKVFFFEHCLHLLGDDETIFKILRKWAKEYGPVYVLGFFNLWKMVNITAAEEFALVASTMKNIEKSEAYEIMHQWLGQGLLTSTGKKWMTNRKILTPSFHFTILQQFVQIFNEETEEVVEILKKHTGQSVNVMPLMSQLTLRTIAATSMGTKLDRENENHKLFTQATYKLGQVLFKRLMRPWYYSNSIYYNLIPMGYYEKKLLRTVHGFCNEIIKKRSDNFVELVNSDFTGKKRLAMLDILLQAQKIEGLIDDKGIQDEVNTFMFEGHDTTALSICYTLMLLATHKNIQDQVYEEMLQILDSKNKYPTINELNDLKLMERVIKESLRLYPSVPFISRTLEEDILTKDGYLLPKGANCNINIIDIHMNPSYWEDPEKFDPDRFLPENCINRHPFAYVPFSAGPRNCIGQKFAILEEKAVLCGILKNFVIEPVHNPETVVIVQHLLLKSKGENLKLKFLLRQ